MFCDGMGDDDMVGRIQVNEDICIDQVAHTTARI